MPAKSQHNSKTTSAHPRRRSSSPARTLAKPRKSTPNPPDHCISGRAQGYSFPWYVTLIWITFFVCGVAYLIRYILLV